MLKNFMAIIQTKLSKENGQAVKISCNDLKEALDEIGKDLIYNYFIFGKGVSFETFINNLTIYLNVTKSIDKEKTNIM